MSSPYYDVTGNPATGAPGASATIRAEFSLIATGFGVLPQTLTANKAVIINAGGTAMGVTTGSLALAGDFSTAGAYSVALTATAATAITLPTTGTLATLAGSEALTNKTYNGNAWTAGTGTLTLGAGKTATVSNTLTFTGTDGSSVAFGTGGTVLYSGGSYVSSITGTANQITASASTGAVTLSLPSALVAPGTVSITGTSSSQVLTVNSTNSNGTTIGISKSSSNIGSIGSAAALLVSGGSANDIVLTSASGYVGLAYNGSTLGLKVDTSGHITMEGVTSTGATGTGNLVYSAAPTFTGTALGDSLFLSSAALNPFGINSTATHGPVLFYNHNSTTLGKIGNWNGVIGSGLDADFALDAVGKLGLAANGVIGITIDTSGNTTHSGTTTLSGALTYGGVTANNAVTGTGNVVLSTSPTFTTPILGTPTSGTLTNCTGYTVGNISGLGTGVGTFLATPTSANLATAVTDETGSGALVFAASPTLSGTVGGALTFSGTHTLSSALTYGGVTLSNSVTGTGSMVLSAGPTLTGTLTAAGANFSGLVTIPRPAATASNSLNSSGTTTSINYWQITNTGGAALFGVESSTGGNLASGAGAYATVIGSENSTAAVIMTNNASRLTVSSAGAVQFNTGYGAGTITSDSSGNLTSVSDPARKIITGEFSPGLPEIVATASPEFMGLHKWTAESGMETEGEYASFFARDNFPIKNAVTKNAKTGINSFYDRPVIMALVNAVATLKAEIDAMKRSE